MSQSQQELIQASQPSESLFDDFSQSTTQTTTKRLQGRTKTKKVLPPFTLIDPAPLHYDPFISRVHYGDVRPWTQTDAAIPSDEPCMVGIDEAGRGPVLGAMVYGTCCVPLSQVQALKDLGVNDSKQLKESDREYLFSLVQTTPYLRWIVDRIGPKSISQTMLSPSKESLNTTSHLSALHMVFHFIRCGFNVQEIYADTVGPPLKYQAWLVNEIAVLCRRYNIKNPVQKVVVESRADSTYPCVSAASICAKVTRDLDLAKWTCIEEQHGMEVSKTFGSGYPGDEVTKTWLRQHFDPVFGFPDLVRFSWGTSETILDEIGFNVRWGGEDDLPSREATAGKARSGFLAPKTAPVSENSPCQWKYMRTNNISATTELPF